MSTFHVEVDADDDLLCVAAIATKEGWGAAELRSVIAVSEFLTDARSRFNVDEVLAAMDEPSRKVKKEIYCVACERVVHSERQACENMQCSLYRYVKIHFFFKGQGASERPSLFRNRLSDLSSSRPML